MKKIFLNKNFSLIFMGSLVSNIGNTFFGSAVGWYVATLLGKDNVIQFGLFMAIGGAIQLLLTPFCGVIADRLNKVRIMYLTDFIRGAVVLVAGYLVFQDISVTQTMIVLYSTQVLLAINGALFGPASSSLIPSVVKEEEFQSANSTMSLVGSIQGMVGLLLGGAIYAMFGIGWIFIINGLSFIISGISEMFIKVEQQKKTDLDFTSGLKDLKEGLKYLGTKKGLMQLMYGSLFLNFAFVPLMAVGFPILFNQILGTSLMQYNYVMVSWSVGTFIGAIIIGNLARNLKVFKAAGIGLIMMVVGWISMTSLIYLILNGQLTYSTFFVWMIIVIFLTGMINMYLNIPLNTAFMKTIEPEFRGRAFSVVGTLSQAAVPLAVFLGGVLLQATDIITLALSSLAVLVVVVIYIFLNKNVTGFLRSLDREQEADREATIQELEPVLEQ